MPKATDELRLAEIPRLALRPAEAARALGLSERKLWSLTNCGEIPCVRAGKALLYPVAQLTEWLAERCDPSRQGGAA